MVDINIFNSKLVDKYGAEILNDFEALKTKQFWNLVDIGNKHGFTREYARQIYNILYDKCYMPAKTGKYRKRKNDTTNCYNDPRHKFAEHKKGNHKKAAKAELSFYNKCKELGFDINFLCNKRIDIKINGWFVDVKSCYTPLKLSFRQKAPYYRFRFSKIQAKKTDFLACYHSHQKTFYIIPKIKYPNSRMIYIRKVSSRYHNAINRYEKYKEAWHLLCQK